MKQYPKGHRRRGQILILFLALTAIGLTLAVGLLSLQSFVYRTAKQTDQARDSHYLAEAGIEYALSLLNQSTVVDDTEQQVGNGSFIVRDLTQTGSERVLESTGYIPDSTNPVKQRRLRVKVKLSTDDVQFFYGVQVDSGGVTMGNNSTINGNIFSNGSLTGSSGARVTGNATVAGGLPDTPTLEWPTQNADQLFATSNSNRDIAQSFTATASGTLGKVSVYLGKTGNPNNNISLRLTSDNGNKPASSALASTTIVYTTVGNSPSWIDASFASAPTVTSGTKYWLVLDYNNSSATNYWNWRKDSTNGYANNTGKFTSNWSTGGASWTDTNADLAFRVWIGGTVTRMQDMTIGNSTSGTGRANEFINTTIHGSACPNSNCIVENPARQNLPITDGLVDDWKSEAAAGGTYNGSYTITNGTSLSLGPQKINGNLTVSNGGHLTVTGTLWVTGTITFSNNCIIQLDSGYGGSSGLIITNSTTTVSNNCTFLGSGTAGSYVMLLSSKNDPSVDVMTIDNNSNGVIYYAGKGRIHFNNNAAAKEATAYGMTLDNNAVITYDSGLANATFSSGPGGAWTIEKGTIQEY